MADEIREPKQERAIKTKERIMQAAIFLFSEQGYHNTNSKEIAKKAETAIGSFYSYFKDKKTLLLEILDNQIKKTLSRVKIELKEILKKNIDNKVKIKELLQSVFDAHDFLTDFHREIVALKYIDDEIRKVRLQEEEKSVELIFYLLKTYTKGLRVKDLSVASRIIYIAIEESVHSVKILKTGLTQEDVIPELTDMIYKYLYT